MSVPDHRDIPRKLFDSGLYNLKTEDGQAAFTDACVATLHARDERWGHLRKKPGQSQIHGHGEDSALYLNDVAGQSQAVDFIGGAGGSNPQPGWIVDEPRYNASDWRDPFDHGFNSAPPAPTPQPPRDVAFPPRNETMAAFDIINADYHAKGRQTRTVVAPELYIDNEGIAVWLQQYLLYRVNGQTHVAAVDQVLRDIDAAWS